MDRQRAIAAVLGALDDKIELNRRMSETLEAMARAIFKSWFVDFDPVRAKMAGRDTGLPKEIADLFPDRLVDSALGEIPEGWEVGCLRDVSQLNPESWTAKSQPDGVRYLDLSSVKSGRFLDMPFLSGEAIPSRAQRILRPGDSVVGTVRPANGSFGLINESGVTGSTGFAVFRPSQSRHRTFVYCVATDRANIERLGRLADGGAYPAVRPDVVAASPCVLPNNRLLDLWEACAGPMMDHVSACEREVRVLSMLRDTLLPKLISGELRIPDPERFLKEVAA
jgi:type I restriction enzyme S subunit